MSYVKANAIANERIQQISTKFADSTATNRDKNELATLIYPKLKFFIWKFCKNDFDTEEALQWTLKKIFNNISKFDFEKGRFTTWIYTIARNETLLYLYHRDKNSNYSLDTVFEKADRGEVSEDPVAIQLDFEDILSATVNAIHTIPDTILKSIAIDKMLNHEKVKDLAIKYNLNENTVKTKLSKIRRDVKAAVLKGNPEFEEKLKHIL
jgi:RNA polymerase sigma-70 factor (ECF subfamily)